MSISISVRVVLISAAVIISILACPEPASVTVTPEAPEPKKLSIVELVVTPTLFSSTSIPVIAAPSAPLYSNHAFSYAACKGTVSLNVNIIAAQ